MAVLFYAKHTISFSNVCTTHIKAQNIFSFSDLSDWISRHDTVTDFVVYRWIKSFHHREIHCDVAVFVFFYVNCCSKSSFTLHFWYFPFTCVVSGEETATACATVRVCVLRFVVLPVRTLWCNSISSYTSQDAHGPSLASKCILSSLELIFLRKGTSALSYFVADI